MALARDRDPPWSGQGGETLRDSYHAQAPAAPGEMLVDSVFMFEGESDVWAHPKRVIAG